MRVMIGSCLAVLLSGLAVAQEATPQLSETERLRLQVASLQQQLASLNGQLEVCRIEGAHPGYRFDSVKGLVTK